MRLVDYRYDLVRNGVPYARLTAVEGSAPMITWQAEAQIQASMTGTFLARADSDWYHDIVRPWMQLNGTWHQLGDYVLSDATETYAHGVSHVTLNLMDQVLRVKQAATEGLLYLRAGTPYLTAIQQLVSGAGILRLLADPCDAVLPADREDWEEGTSYLVIVNALLGEIGYNPLWFDHSGTARLTKYTEPSAANIKHTYASGKALIAPGCTITADVYNPANVFKVLVSNSDLPAPMVATAVNDYPKSRISTVNLGRRVPAPIVRLDSIASQDALQAYANQLRLASLLGTEKITYTTANEPGHGYLDTTALEHERLKGIYMETDWTMTLSHAGQMQHKARRVMYL